MKIHLEKELFKEIVDDLSRPHPFAFERVSYLLGDVINDMIVINEWLGFKDSYYLQAEDVGARIGTDGMAMVMKKALQTRKLFFHTHIHEFQDRPEFSYVDIRSLKEVTPSLFDFSGRGPHGAILIGKQMSRLIYWEDAYCKSVKEINLETGLWVMEGNHELKK